MGKAIQLCCCCSLKTGCICSAIMSLIGALIYAYLTGLSVPFGCIIWIYRPTVDPILLLVMFIIKFLEGILLICGATMKKVGLCYAWMAFALIEGILHLISGTIYFLAASSFIKKEKEEQGTGQLSENGFYIKNSSTHYQEEALINIAGGLFNVLQFLWLFYIFFVVLNFIFEVKEKEEGNLGTFRPEDQQMRGYPSDVRMQMGYSPNYNPYPSYEQQAAMYPSSQRPSTQGMYTQQNFQTGDPTPD